MRSRWLISTLVAFAIAAPSQAAAFTTTQLDATAWPRVGKLFLTKPGGTVSCSAAVVDAPNQSTLITAGHCLNSAGNGVAASARFAPGYHDGVSPFGQWTSQQLLPAPQWDTVNHHYDYGFIVLARNATEIPVEDAVGAFPLAFFQPRAQGYRILGYPGEPPPFDGSKLWQCDTTYAGDFSGAGSGPPMITAGCDMGEGASGGPWLNGAGVVTSITSFKPSVPADTLAAPYLDGSAAALFATAGNISTEKPKPDTAPAKKKCRKHKRKKRRSASSAKKKCKKKHRRHH